MTAAMHERGRHATHRLWCDGPEAGGGISGIGVAPRSVCGRAIAMRQSEANVADAGGRKVAGGACKRRWPAPGRLTVPA
jgi:hypothetical protein